MRSDGNALRQARRERLLSLFAHYDADHQNPLNRQLHVVCVPLILWSVAALLWTIPVPGTWLKPGSWAVLAMFLAWSFYWRHSRPLGAGMLVVFVGIAASLWWLQGHFGSARLALIAAAVFVLAWIGQFYGHHLEGRRPSFLTDLVYLLIGPAWVLGKLYRHRHWPLA